jgi:hypothetical protein
MQIRYVLLTAVLLFGQSKEDISIQKERTNLERESDPADRAKIAVKIADLLITQLTSAARTADDPLVERHLKDYTDIIQDAYAMLMNSGRDAHKHPAGFKDLEIALRKQQRRLEDAGRLLPYDRRVSIDQVRKQISDFDDQLVEVMLLKDTNAAKPK